MKRETKKIILAALAVLLLAFAMFLCWRALRPEPQAGAKTLAISVTHADGAEQDFTLNTDAEYLWDAMLEAELIDGTDSEYGKWVTTVDGESADEANGQYWLFTKGGEWVETACDKTPIADGDAFEFFIYEYAG